MFGVSLRDGGLRLGAKSLDGRPLVGLELGCPQGPDRLLLRLQSRVLALEFLLVLGTGGGDLLRRLFPCFVETGACLLGVALQAGEVGIEVRGRLFLAPVQCLLAAMEGVGHGLGQRRSPGFTEEVEERHQQGSREENRSSDSVGERTRQSGCR